MQIINGTLAVGSFLALIAIMVMATRKGALSFAPADEGNTVKIKNSLRERVAALFQRGESLPTGRHWAPVGVESGYFTYGIDSELVPFNTIVGEHGEVTEEGWELLDQLDVGYPTEDPDAAPVGRHRLFS